MLELALEVLTPATRGGMQMLLRKSAPVFLGSIVTLSLFTGACATKKHVREAIAPVQTQVNDVSKKTDSNTSAIGDLDRNVAKVDEKAMEADRKAGSAGDAARQANQAASQAQQTATGANQLAQQSMNRAGQVESKLDTTVNNLDNYKLAGTEKVYFRVNRADLTKDEMAKLDQAVQNVAGAKNYVIEVEGYTDRTGPKSLNLDLSRRRAEAVVRYLTVEKNIPLRKIHDVGVGADFPNAVNKTRADRKENRRVEVKVFTLDMTGTTAQNQPSTPTSR
jgi:outer membrane protein OmpA-like peptidoglycan-associated protein